MEHRVAVEQPLTGPFGRPDDAQRRARCHETCDDAQTMLARERVIPQAVSLPQDVEVEAVQMHGVRLGAQVDHTPAHDLADVVSQVFRVGPSQAVDGEEDEGPQLEELAHSGLDAPPDPQAVGA